MGTRGLTIVKLGGKIKIAQYGQWDHYPTGQGETISEFIREKLDLRKFKAKVKALQFVNEDEIHDLWKEEGISGPGVSVEVYEKFKKKYPQFTRDTGAEILEMVQNEKIDKLKNSIDFLEDGLFCEYAYELDLDKKTVRVHVAGAVVKVLKFSEFSKKGAMKKLEQELQAMKYG